MILIGENKHIEQGVKLLRKHLKEFNFGQFKDDNSAYYKGLMQAIAKDKTSIVSINNDNVIDGVLLGMRVPNLLNPHNLQFHILLTWVHPDKRGSSIFYRMYKKLEKDVLKNEEVIFYSIPKTNINFNKLGFKEFQTMYIKEIK